LKKDKLISKLKKTPNSKFNKISKRKLFLIRCLKKIVNFNLNLKGRNLRQLKRLNSKNSRLWMSKPEVSRMRQISLQSKELPSCSKYKMLNMRSSLRSLRLSKHNLLNKKKRGSKKRF
jgi:hypothetical protein